MVFGQKEIKAQTLDHKWKRKSQSSRDILYYQTLQQQKVKYGNILKAHRKGIERGKVILFRYIQQYFKFISPDITTRLLIFSLWRLRYYLCAEM